MSKHPEQFTVEAWSANAIAFIEEQGLTREFSDWCGGWPCPVDPKMVAAAPELLGALDLALEYWSHRQQRYKNRHPVWVQAAQATIAKARGEV